MKGNKDSNIISAKARFLRVSPRKLRLVADAIRAYSPAEALKHLSHLPQRPAGILAKVILQAVANAKTTLSTDANLLKFAKIMIEEGPRGPKKLDIHSHGARYNRGIRRKRYSHIQIELTK